VRHLVLIVAVFAALLQVQAMAADFPIEGIQAPGFNLPDLSGTEHSLSDYLGKPLVINFWTTWCGACKYEFPVLESFSQDYHEQVRLITICAGNSQEEALAAVQEKGVGFLVLYDAQEVISKEYQPPRPRDKKRVVAFPFSVFVDKEGKVVYARIGTFTDIDSLISLLEQSGIDLVPAVTRPSDEKQPIDHGEKADSG